MVENLVATWLIDRSWFNQLMRLGLMQPYFFPYLGYFDLIMHTDVFVIFDEAQHIRRGWINRNRVLHPTQGWQYVNVPLRKAAREARIRNICIQSDVPWKAKLLMQLQHYRKEAPYFNETVTLIESCLKVNTESISQLNTQILKKVCDHLGIIRTFKVLSELQVDLSGIQSPADWAIRVCTAMGAENYINLSGGRAIYSEAEFEQNGLRLRFTDFPPPMYKCGTYEFSEGLSVIDVLMWNGRLGTANFLNQSA